MSANDDKKNTVERFNRNICIWNKWRNKTQKEGIKCINRIKHTKMMQIYCQGRNDKQIYSDDLELFFFSDYSDKEIYTCITLQNQK